MENIGNRLKLVYKKYNLKQKEFASEIGLSQRQVNDIIANRSKTSETVIKLVCLKYRVNEVWLRTGVGKPYECETLSTTVGEIQEILKKNPELAEQVLKYVKFLQSQS